VAGAKRKCVTQDFEALAEAPQLSRLVLRNLWRTSPSLTPLKQLLRLRSLQLHGQKGCMLTSLQPVVALTNLERLYLECLPAVSSVAGLRNLQSLRELCIAGAPLPTYRRV
jgi:hypothetical protein